jgi:cytochrome c-type biogenesis protein CcmE
MKTSNVKYGLGALTIVGVVAYFGVTGFQSSMMYYLAVDEVDASLHDGRGVKVMGQVAEGSIQWLDAKRRVRFDVQGTSGRRIPVAFDDLTPDNFDAGRNVIIVGRYQGGSITAKQVIVQCPSKYEAAEYDPTAAEAHSSAQQSLAQQGGEPPAGGR